MYYSESSLGMPYHSRWPRPTVRTISEYYAGPSFSSLSRRKSNRGQLGSFLHLLFPPNFSFSPTAVNHMSSHSVSITAPKKAIMLGEKLLAGGLSCMAISARILSPLLLSILRFFPHYPSIPCPLRCLLVT